MTVMTNFGFHRAMRDAGITVVTTKVGDRHVLAALREHGYTLGGEQSGHIIELGFAPSGDGIASALLTLEALGGRDLAAARVFDAAAPAAHQRPGPRRRDGRRGGAGRARGGVAGSGPARRQRPRPRASERDRAARARHGRGAVLRAGDRVCEQVAAAVRAAA